MMNWATWHKLFGGAFFITSGRTFTELLLTGILCFMFSLISPPPFDIGMFNRRRKKKIITAPSPHFQIGYYIIRRFFSGCLGIGISRSGAMAWIVYLFFSSFYFLLFVHVFLSLSLFTYSFISS